MGIGNAFLRYVGKLLLKETGSDGKEACGYKQLCTGLEAGIKGVLHSIVEVASRNDSFHYESGEAEESYLQGESGSQEAAAVEEGP